MAYLMGIDLGTSGVRAGIYNDSGVCLGIAAAQYPIDTPAPDRAEQDPAEWWRRTCDCIRGALERSGIGGGDIGGISLSGQMHGTVLLDRYGEPSSPAIIWADSRSGDECAELAEILGEKRLTKIIMNRMFPGTQAATIQWLRKHDRATWNSTRRILAPKDYIRYRMCGLFNTEPSDASATLLFDVGVGEWSEDVLKALALPIEYFPYVVNSDQYIAETEDIEDVTGLPDGIPVIMGGGDQPCAALGNGVLDEGMLLATIGTGGQLFAPTASPKISPDLSLNTFCHLQSSRWYVMGATLAAGLSLKWFRDTFHPEADFHTLAAEAAKVPPGTRGLTFVPHLAGTRSPKLDPEAKGSFAGIDLGHGRGHFVRAIMEGVAFELRSNLDVMRGMGIAPERVVFSGGGAKSPLWSQILADVFGVPVTVSTREEAACFGAALLAGIGAGVYTGFKDAAARVDKGEQTVEPERETAERYNEIYAAFQEQM